ncbi:MAG: hypothetical protein JSR86_14690 [Proteobacteria bacterium]|nr:hypothetical protein [Pseudomonadota bacterium]
MAGLEVSFTRITPDRHRFAYRRPDGTGEAIEMETSSLLQHDLLHLAVESEAGLRGSFYGLLAKVGGYEELRVAGGAALGGEIAITERVVGALTGALAQAELDDEAFVAQVRDFLDLYDERAPRWLTGEFVTAVRERMRQLEGRWKATPFGQTMTLDFDP